MRESMTEDSGSIFTADTISTKLRRIEDIIKSHIVLEEAFNLKIAQRSERFKLKSEKLENEGNDRNALKSVRIHNSDNPAVKKVRIIQPEREPKVHEANSSSSSSSVQKYAQPYKEEKYANPYKEKKYAHQYEAESDVESEHLFTDERYVPIN
jgi:hypothetical protein